MLRFPRVLAVGRMSHFVNYLDVWCQDHICPRLHSDQSHKFRRELFRVYQPTPPLLPQPRGERAKEDIERTEVMGAALKWTFAAAVVVEEGEEEGSYDDSLRTSCYQSSSTYDKLKQAQDEERDKRAVVAERRIIAVKCSKSSTELFSNYYGGLASNGVSAKDLWFPAYVS
ncbi:hypothetical protein Tco_0133722 [Tanacetum coccineum]